MFNLLITTMNGQWDGTPYQYGRNRVFEHTLDTLKDRFGQLHGEALDELLALPCLFAYEQNEGSDARIGTITSVQVRGRDVRLEYVFNPNLPPITNDQLQQLVWEFDINDWELNRTHWAIKEANLFEELIKKGFLTEAQVTASHIATLPIVEPPALISIAPTVFRKPDTDIEPDLISVMRPFHESFSEVQDTLETTCTGIGLRCLAVNQIWGESEIVQDIFSLIFRSRAVICDFSNQNPNVFYEAGIAHTLGRPVIPIVQNKDDVPFDLRHHRYIEYENSPDGLVQLSVKILPRLKYYLI